MNEQQGSRLPPLSVAQRREIMWNFTEPGDPYDIRKSMIARLPGEQKFMGPHLELVCLLQAAQIERLCQCLQEFKMRIRQGERVELDRHSYEVQIKELTERISEENNFRIQIEKLREFIRRQSSQLQELQNIKQDKQLQRNYQESLKQIAELKLVNNKLVSQLRATHDLSISQSQKWQQQFENSKNELQNRGNSIVQLEAKYREATARWETEKKQMEQRLAQDNRQIQQRVSQIDEQNQKLRKEVERLTIESVKAQQISHTMSEYQNRFQILAQEIDRLNGVLRQKSREFTEEAARGRQLGDLVRRQNEQLAEWQAKTKELQNSNLQLQRQNRETLASLSTLEQTKTLTQSYEASLEKLSIEVDRLNSVLRKKLNELDQARRRNNEAQIRLKTLESLEKQVGDLKARQGEAGRKMAEYEKEVAQGQQEIQRLNYSIKKLIEELNSMQLRYKNAQKESDNRQKTIQILNEEIDQQRSQRQAQAAQLVSLMTESQALKASLARNEQNKRISDTKISQYMGEVKRLQGNLSQMDEEVNSLRNSHSQKQIKIRQVESINQSDQLFIEELLGKNQHLEIELNRVVAENESLKKTLQDRNEMPQAQLTQMSQEINRLTNILHIRDNQISKLTNNRQEQPSTQKPKEAEISKAQQELNFMRMNLIQKEQTMHYYLSENEKYYTENQTLRNTLDEREARIERLQNEIQQINRIIGQPTEGQKLDLTDERVRLQVQHGVLKERFTSLTQENQQNLQKVHHLQQEIIRLQYQLRHSAEKSVPKQQEQEKKEGLAPSQSGDSLEVDDRGQLFRDIESLRRQCAFLTEQKQRNKLVQQAKEEEIGRLKSQLQKTENFLIQERSKGKQSSLVKEEVNYQQEYEAILQRHNGLILKYEKLQEQLRKLKDQQTTHPMEIGQETQQLKQKNQLIADYYNRILIFSSEIQRLNAVMAAKEKEKEGLVKDYGQRIQNYEAAIRNLEENRVGYSNEQRQHLIQQNIRLQGGVAKLQQELHDERTRIQQFHWNSNSKIQLLQAEVIRLNKALETKMQQYHILQDNISTIGRQLDEQRHLRRDLGSNFNEYESKIIVMGQEIGRLNAVLETKVESYKNLQEQYKHYRESTINRLNQNPLQGLQDYQAKITQQSKQIQRLTRLLLANQQHSEQLLEKQERCRNEIERLNNALRLKVEESLLLQSRDVALRTEKQASQRQARQYEALVVRYRQLDEENFVNKQHLAEYQKRIKVLYEEFQRLQKIITALKKDNQDKGAQVNDLIQKNRFLGAELQRINKINRQQKEELTDLRLNIAHDDSLQRRINEHLALFVVLFGEIEALRQQVRQQEEEIEEVRQQNIAARLV